MVISEPSKTATFLTATTGGIDKVKATVNASVDEAQTQFSTALQANPANAATATDQSNESLKKARSVESAGLAFIGLIDPLDTPNSRIKLGKL